MAQSLFSLITLATIVAAAPYAKRDALLPVNAGQTTTNSQYVGPGGIAPTGPPILPQSTAIRSTGLPVSPTFTTFSGPVTTYIDPTTTIVGIGPIITEIPFYDPPSCYPYVSQAGDTCESIGEAFGLTADAIFSSNTFLDCEDIWVNTPICVMIHWSTDCPPGVCVPAQTLTRPTSTAVVPPVSCNTYTSKSGDTCESIATSFGLTADEIYAANTFLDCQNIWPYTPICIPASYPIATTPSPGTDTTVHACEFTYYSKQGDTCDTLSAALHAFPGKILIYNSFLSCNDIWTNTPICVPPPDWPACPATYTSSETDTCDTIGAKVGLPGSVIYNANTFLNCDDIWPWTEVCIPYTF